jgi:hypothetical protein
MSERGRGEEASEGIIDLLVDFLADSPLIPVLSGLVVLWVFFASQSDVFLSPRNISNILIQSVVLSLLALAVSFVLLVAEIDLSVASISGVTSVLMANLLIKFGQSVPVAVIGAILFGMAIGFVNGYITLRLMISLVHCNPGDSAHSWWNSVGLAPRHRSVQSTGYTYYRTCERDHRWSSGLGCFPANWGRYLAHEISRVPRD